MTIEERSAAELRRRLLEALPADVRDAVAQVVSCGGPGVYAVGGCVRDVILERRPVDVDLVTERDAIDVVRQAMRDARLTAHARFRTASFAVGGWRIDVATARSERYARPGALPHVSGAPIGDDLRRRDFSVNAMALRLDGDVELLDPCAGAADARAGVIRALHDRSFIDDATRIYRALRYAGRLGFRIDAATDGWLRSSLRFLDAIGGERVRREIELVLREPTAADILSACESAGVLRATHAALRWEERRSAALAAPPVPSLPLLPYGFALLAANVTPAVATSIGRRLRLKRDESAAVDAIAALGTAATVLRRPSVHPSGVVALLDRYPASAVAAFAATADERIAGAVALRYLEEWRHVRPALGGRDLVAIGVPEGPQVQRGLQLLRAARLDGRIENRQGEEAIAMRFAHGIRDAGRGAAGPPERDDH
jgi:tRNA nucleotidyltransferase (CCA-adding enzyme)